MSDNIEDEGPAFPHMPDGRHWNVGISLRDYFAAKACSLPDVMFASLFSYRWAAALAYVHADAMLKAKIIE